MIQKLSVESKGTTWRGGFKRGELAENTWQPIWLGRATGVAWPQPHEPAGASPGAPLSRPPSLRLSPSGRYSQPGDVILLPSFYVVMETGPAASNRGLVRRREGLSCRLTRLAPHQVPEVGAAWLERPLSSAAAAAKKPEDGPKEPFENGARRTGDFLFGLSQQPAERKAFGSNRLLKSLASAQRPLLEFGGIGNFSVGRRKKRDFGSSTLLG